ncbi:unnamed protein product [Ixodes hexagonus]
MPVDSLLILRRSFHHDQPARQTLSWDVVAAVLLVIMLVILLVSHLMASVTNQQTSTFFALTTGRTANVTTATVPTKISKQAGNPLAYREFEDVPVIPAAPEVLICGTSGLGSTQLPGAISSFCSHAIFTGELLLDQDEYGAYYFSIPDQEALSEFLKVKSPPVKRYVSVACSLFHGNGSADIVAAVSRLLSKHDLSGVELRAGSQEDLHVAAMLYREFYRSHPTNVYLILRVSPAVLPDKKFFKDASIGHLFSNPAFVLLPPFQLAIVSRVPPDDVITRTFSRPSRTFGWGTAAKVGTADAWSAVFCAARQSTDATAATSLDVALTAVPASASLLAGASTTNQQGRDIHLNVNRVSVIHGSLDVSMSLSSQLSRLLGEFPGLCVAAYDVEYDDVDGYCKASGRDVGAPLVGVLHSMVFPQ